MAHVVDDVPVAQYRFKRVARQLTEFEPVAHRLQTDPTKKWHRTPFATRLLDGGPDRVTLLHDRLKIRRDGDWTESPVEPGRWAAVLAEWFGIELPGVARPAPGQHRDYAPILPDSDARSIRLQCARGPPRLC